MWLTLASQPTDMTALFVSRDGELNIIAQELQLTEKKTSTLNTDSSPCYDFSSTGASFMECTRQHFAGIIKTDTSCSLPGQM